MLFKLILIVSSLNVDNTIRIDEYTIADSLTRAECVTLMLDHNKAFKAERSYSEFICDGNESNVGGEK